VDASVGCPDASREDPEHDFKCGEDEDAEVEIFLRGNFGGPTGKYSEILPLTSRNRNGHGICVTTDISPASQRQRCVRRIRGDQLPTNATGPPNFDAPLPVKALPSLEALRNIRRWSDGSASDKFQLQIREKFDRVGLVTCKLYLSRPDDMAVVPSYSY
jgi:hypothetical protein